MKRSKSAGISYILFFSTLISLSFFSCRQENNLIINGNFEQDLVSGRIPGWEMDVNMEKQKIWLEEKDVYHGKRSLAIRVIQFIKPVNAAGLAVRTGAQCILSQKISLEKDSRYVLSLMYRRE